MAKRLASYFKRKFSSSNAVGIPQEIIEMRAAIAVRLSGIFTGVISDDEYLIAASSILRSLREIKQRYKNLDTYRRIIEDGMARRDAFIREKTGWADFHGSVEILLPFTQLDVDLGVIQGDDAAGYHNELTHHLFVLSSNSALNQAWYLPHVAIHENNHKTQNAGVIHRNRREIPSFVEAVTEAIPALMDRKSVYELAPYRLEQMMALLIKDGVSDQDVWRSLVAASLTGDIDGGPNHIVVIRPSGVGGARYTAKPFRYMYDEKYGVGAFNKFMELGEGHPGMYSDAWFYSPNQFSDDERRQYLAVESAFWQEYGRSVLPVTNEPAVQNSDVPDIEAGVTNVTQESITEQINAVRDYVVKVFGMDRASLPGMRVIHVLSESSYFEQVIRSNPGLTREVLDFFKSSIGGGISWGFTDPVTKEIYVNADSRSQYGFSPEYMAVHEYLHGISYYRTEVNESGGKTIYSGVSMIITDQSGVVNAIGYQSLNEALMELIHRRVYQERYGGEYLQHVPVRNMTEELVYWIDRSDTDGTLVMRAFVNGDRDGLLSRMREDTDLHAFLLSHKATEEGIDWVTQLINEVSMAGEFSNANQMLKQYRIKNGLSNQSHSPDQLEARVKDMLQPLITPAFLETVRQRLAAEGKPTPVTVDDWVEAVEGTAEFQQLLHNSPNRAQLTSSLRPHLQERVTQILQTQEAQSKPYNPWSVLDNLGRLIASVVLQMGIFTSALFLGWKGTIFLFNSQEQFLTLIERWPKVIQHIANFMYYPILSWRLADFSAGVMAMAAVSGLAEVIIGVRNLFTASKKRISGKATVLFGLGAFVIYQMYDMVRLVPFFAGTIIPGVKDYTNYLNYIFHPVYFVQQALHNIIKDPVDAFVGLIGIALIPFIKIAKSRGWTVRSFARVSATALRALAGKVGRGFWKVFNAWNTIGSTMVGLAIPRGKQLLEYGTAFMMYAFEAWHDAQIRPLDHHLQPRMVGQEVADPSLFKYGDMMEVSATFSALRLFFSLLNPIVNAIGLKLSDDFYFWASLVPAAIYKILGTMGYVSYFGHVHTQPEPWMLAGPAVAVPILIAAHYAMPIWGGVKAIIRLVNRGGQRVFMPVRASGEVVGKNVADFYERLIHSKLWNFVQEHITQFVLVSFLLALIVWIISQIVSFIIG